MNVTVLSGQSTSGAFTLVGGTGGQALAVFAPTSLNATEVRLQFATSSNGTWSTLTRTDGSGAPFAVFSGIGPGVGVLPLAPTAWGRVSLVSSQADARSFEILQVY